jgi:hypothetical protein
MKLSFTLRKFKNDSFVSELGVGSMALRLKHAQLMSTAFGTKDDADDESHAL